MAKKEKYLWQIGYPPPKLDRHSETKHRIVEDYVRRYILTLMSPANIPALQLSLIDGFCGGGNYTDESGGLADGSPILMMKAVREARALLNIDRRTPRTIGVDFSFIDILPQTAEYLQYWRNAKLDEGAIDQCDVARSEIVIGSFDQELPRLIKQVKARRMGERALFLLDQYNYNDIPLHSLREILQSMAGAEVIFTFNVGSLITFISNRANHRKSAQQLGLDAYIPWDRLPAIKMDKQNWRQILQRHLAYGIRQETGAKYITLFFVKPWGSNSWDYWLIHLSNHYRAHDVMKRLHWENATEFGHELEPGVFVLGYDANKDESYTGQTPFDFGIGSRSACIDGVREFFGETIFAEDRPVAVGEIFQGCISISTGAEQHLMEATTQLHQSKSIIVTTKDGRLRRPSKIYRMDDILVPNKQIVIAYQ